MIFILIINTIILFILVERLKPITGSPTFDFNFIRYIQTAILRSKLKIGDYYAHVGYRDIDDFMLEDKIDEIVIVKNFGKKYVEVEVIEERNKSPVAIQSNYSISSAVTLPSGYHINKTKKYLTLRHFSDYYRKYSGYSPGIKKIDFGKEMEQL